MPWPSWSQKLYSDNWFATLDLLHHFRSREIQAIGTIRLNRLRGCPLDANKDLMKNGRDAMDCRCDSNSEMMTVKWVDNSVANLTSNFIGVEPVGELERRRWKKTFHVLKLFNNTTIALEVSTWRTCCYHCIEYRARQSADTKIYSGISLIRQRSVLGSYTVVTFVRMENHKMISLELSDVLILANKVNPYSTRGWPQKRRSLEAPTTDKKPTQALPVTDVRFDQVVHLPSPTTNKSRCRLRSMTCRMQYSKCKIFLCLLNDCNCFIDFHTKP